MTVDTKKSIIKSATNNVDYYEIISFGFNTINHVLIGTISIYMTFKCYFLGFDSTTVQHTYFCTIGVRIFFYLLSSYIRLNLYDLMS